MKRLVWLTFAILLFASACTTYTCPTYSKYEDVKQESEDAEELKF